MAYWRFYRKIPLIPGLLYLNISKHGISFSFGKRGLTITLGKKGFRFSIGLPGTGLSYREYIKFRKNNKKQKTKYRRENE